MQQDPILDRARKLFGEERFQECAGQIWLDLPWIMRRMARRRPLDSILKEWEDRYRRDVEEGRYQQGHRRHRVSRFSELAGADDRRRGGASVEASITQHARRTF